MATKEKTEVITELEEHSGNLLNSVKNTKTQMLEFCDGQISSQIDEDTDKQVRMQLASYKRATTNIRKAYIQSINMNDELSTRWNELTQSKKKRVIPHAPTNSQIDLIESKSNHFAQGLNVYKLLLVCFIGCFVGVIIELAWCLVKHGYLESRSGLVYGPFNLLYGAGAVVFTLVLYAFRNRGKLVVFCVSFLTGSAFEYACSWIQETLFDTRSWDYSAMPFDLNGRICVMYSIFWGIIGLFWIKSLYPRVAALILKIPNKIGKIATWTLTVFFIINIIMSSVAVFRWSQRTKGIEPTNIIWEIVDERFPDERMERIYPNMEFKEK